MLQLSWSFSQWPKRGVGLGEGLTAPFQIAFLGQSLFLFSPVCGQSHSKASGPKVSWSIIPILHCKQTGCLLPRCVPDTEISSLSAVHKKYVFGNGWHWLLNLFYGVQQCAWPLSCYVLWKILQLPAKVVSFSEQNLTGQSRTLRGGGVCLWATVTDVYTQNTQGAWWDVLKVTVIL